MKLLTKAVILSLCSLFLLITLALITRKQLMNKPTLQYLM